jgi:hypothetical protein
MRWKFLFITALAAAIVGCGLWCVFAITTFGSARALARNDSLLLVSTVIPLGVTALAAIFVYRHTSRRRRTQALVTVIVTLFFTVGVYLAASLVFVDKLYIPSAYEVRHAR